MFDSFEAPWIVAHHTPLSMGFPRQKYWSGLSFLSPWGLPDPGIEPVSPVLAGRFHQGSPLSQVLGKYSDVNP